MKIEKVHCFFEQSGTFKNEFKRLGIKAYDYDILNDFNQTDYMIDLFNEIEKAYQGGRSVFDTISQEDLIIAFFPCTRFENQVLLEFRCDAKQFKNWNLKQKLEYNLELHKGLQLNYETITKFVIVCLNKKLRLIIENPYSTQHFLTKYWCVKPSIIEFNRRQHGDCFVKPTQFWFINCEPEQKIIFDLFDKAENKISNKCSQVERSMITGTYANYFIRSFVL